MVEAYHAQKGPFIRELQPGQRFIGFYILRSMQLEPFRDPSRGVYLTLILGDRSGQMLARVWENAEEIAEVVERGQVVKVEGEAETYQERTQIKILRIRLAQEDEYDARDFIPSSERDVEEMLAELDSYRERVTQPALRALLDAFFMDAEFLRLFRQAPAARRVHHAYQGGLLEYTVDLLRLSQTILEVYHQVDADLLYAGVLLHDVGKTREYTWGLDIDYTDEGRLVGHLVLSYEMVNQAMQVIPDFPEELALRIRHMLVSHHGRLEWGSPRRPQTLEAIALHHLENLNTQVNRFQLLLQNRPAGESWTPYDRLLGRQLYAGTEEDLREDDQGWVE